MTKKNRKRSAGIVLRDILLALLLVAVVAASAILVYRRFFESGPATPDEKRNIAMNHYDADSFYEENGMLRYAKSAHLTGVDVSEHQEKIDWAAVRAAGVDFAILRIGYRGYTEGSLREDSWFAENYTAARAAGVQLGVYFFSQATTLEEAREEADYTLELLDGRTLELPVFYDWETVAGSTRIPSPDGLPLTQCAAAFCQTVEAAGYTAGVYFNQTYGYTYFDLGYLQDYVLWLAEYGHDAGISLSLRLPAIFQHRGGRWHYRRRGSQSVSDAGEGKNDGLILKNAARAASNCEAARAVCIYFDGVSWRTTY